MTERSRFLATMALALAVVILTPAPLGPIIGGAVAAVELAAYARKAPR